MSKQWRCTKKTVKFILAASHTHKNMNSSTIKEKKKFFFDMTRMAHQEDAHTEKNERYKISREKSRNLTEEN